MTHLTVLPNIGIELAKRLEIAGIHNAEQLKSLGTETVFIRLKTVFPSACHNQLYAIEGAIQGIRWHGIDKVRKIELQEFMKSLENQ